jgi:bifunctional non-homologous end joining protein LigD
MAGVRAKSMKRVTKARAQQRGNPLSELIPKDVENAKVQASGHIVQLTHLKKLFWPELGITKGDLLRYYAQISPFLLPHLQDRAMVMKRYPNGAAGDFFFQKRAPEPRPDWIEICPIEHRAGMVQFPIVRDLASLLWIVNLGCIDLNPWYGRCDDINRPDYLHFDLDPVEGTGFSEVLETALAVHQALDYLEIPSYAKTTGSRGIHVYVPIERGPTQKEVWTFAKGLAQELASQRPDLITAEYRVARRPAGHVLVDYNQNAWGRTLASVYSVRPAPRATVSMPVAWDQIKRGIEVEDFHIKNVPARLKKTGDLWSPLLESRGRFRLENLLNRRTVPG